MSFPVAPRQVKVYFLKFVVFLHYSKYMIPFVSPLRVSENTGVYPQVDCVRRKKRSKQKMT